MTTNEVIIEDFLNIFYKIFFDSLLIFFVLYHLFPNAPGLILLHPESESPEASNNKFHPLKDTPLAVPLP